jgi:hypothetical protein
VLVAALVSDLMDRSRITAAVADVRFIRRVDDAPPADVVILDLARHGDDVGALRTLLPQARIVAFGPHVDEAAANAARQNGADLVFPRSRFFHDPAAALAL